MTTIYFDGVDTVYADRKVVFHNNVQFTNKLIRRPGCVITGCGLSQDVQAFLTWWDDQTTDYPVMDKSTGIYVFGSDQIRYYHDSKQPVLLPKQVLTDGSGGDAMRAALLALPEAMPGRVMRAFEIAAQVDLYTSAAFDAMKIEPTPCACR